MESAFAGCDATAETCGLADPATCSFRKMCGWSDPLAVEPNPNRHVHWHRLVKESRDYCYYECACGSRRSGLRNGSRMKDRIDSEWLTGADRDPR